MISKIYIDRQTTFVLFCFVYIASDPRPLFPFPNLRAVPLPPFPLPPILRTLFQVPYPVSPAFATLAKTPGVCGYSSHFGKACAVTGTRTRFYSSSFFSHSCALFCAFLHSRKTQLFYFQTIPHSLPKTRGVGGSFTRASFARDATASRPRRFCYSGRPKMRASSPLPPQSATRKRKPAP